MEVRAVAKGIRISADKARLTMNLICGKDIIEARNILVNLHNKASRIIIKVLDSAVANAENNNGLKKENLYVLKCHVDEGSVIKRVIIDSRSHTGRNDHQTSHITVIVAEKQA
ncbi:MAG: 50S ribosomal protein L22 [Bacilli bacterium]|nr:50S ribosomal protein L22 [Bacilli bacterium]MDD3304793.1 50S ribosomal protein L22 [Bacilli bacterium]MDD4053379.1 50S ribosomal protein L22 [Bacilli bacterium]MDD4410974.1 50S ribosomal protein L22 [Bacilli bacterium]